jgi:hypothetical protein
LVIGSSQEVHKQQTQIHETHQYIWKPNNSKVFVSKKTKYMENAQLTQCIKLWFGNGVADAGRRKRVIVDTGYVA